MASTELINLPAAAALTGAELVPMTQGSGPNSAVNAELIALLLANASVIAATDGGTTNAYVLTTGVSFTVLAKGQLVFFTPANVNTGASTVIVNGIGSPAPLLNQFGAALAAGELIGPTLITWTTSAWQIVSTGSPSLFAITQAENDANVTPTNYAYPPGNVFRYGADPTGTNDSTTAIQLAINAVWEMFNFTDGQGLWAGNGGVVPVLQLPPGRFMLSGTLFLPTGMTLRGTGHPAHTTNHTRLIMNSTGTCPARPWSATTNIIFGSSIVPSGAPTGYFTATSGTARGFAGTTGSTQPAWNTLAIGNTTTDGSVTWTYQGLTCVAAMTGVDNRNKPMIKFQRGTLPGLASVPGNALANSAVTSTIQELEFWYVTMGNNFNNPLAGGGIAWQNYPLGGTIAFDVDAADFYIVDSVFQNTPCAFWCSGIGSQTTGTRGDGFPAEGRGIGVIIDRCEFDAAAAHVWAQNCLLNILFRHCAFFATVSFYQGCTGSVDYLDCWFEGGACIDAVTTNIVSGATVNQFTSFSVQGGRLEQSTLPAYQTDPAALNIYGDGVAVVDIKGLTCIGGSNFSCLRLEYVASGQVSLNSIINAGINDGVGNSAAVKLVDCGGVNVTTNNISTPSSGTYAGHGIYTESVNHTSQRNFIADNLVGGSYANYITTATGDVQGVNYLPADVNPTIPTLSVTTLLGVAGGSAVLAKSAATFTSGAGTSTGTLTNAPAAGNPTSWIAINDNGTIRHIPAW